MILSFILLLSVSVDSVNLLSVPQGEIFFFYLSVNLFLHIILFKFSGADTLVLHISSISPLTFLFAHGCLLAWQKHCPQFCFPFTILVIPGDYCEPLFSWNGEFFIPSEILVINCRSQSHLLLILFYFLFWKAKKKVIPNIVS